jgi:hypothetical protein
MEHTAHLFHALPHRMQSHPGVLVPRIETHAIVLNREHDLVPVNPQLDAYTGGLGVLDRVV